MLVTGAALTALAAFVLAALQTDTPVRVATLVTFVLATSAVLAVSRLARGQGTALPARADRAADGASSGDGAWVTLAEDCVALLDEIDRVAADLDAPSHAYAGHIGSRIVEMLERSGVAVIAEDASYDRLRHRPIDGTARPGDPIAETVRAGFAIDARVLRRAWVRLEQPPTDDGGTP